MGTRCLTHFINEQGNDIVTMYRQYDGYLEGHGKDLAEFLAPFYVTNGISFGEKRKTANGMSCLTAQAIAHFKNESGAGGIYLEPANTKDCWEEYNYTVYLDTRAVGRPTEKGLTDEGVLKIKVENVYSLEIIFDGTAQELLTKLDEPLPDLSITWNTEVCEKCDSEFKHYLHAKNHYAKHHLITI